MLGTGGRDCWVEVLKVSSGRMGESNSRSTTNVVLKDSFSASLRLASNASVAHQKGFGCYATDTTGATHYHEISPIAINVESCVCGYVCVYMTWHERLCSRVGDET